MWHLSLQTNQKGNNTLKQKTCEHMYGINLIFKP